MAEFAEFDDEIDPALLQQLDVIEAQYIGAPPTKQPPPPPAVPKPAATRPVQTTPSFDPSLEAWLLQGFDSIDDEVEAVPSPAPAPQPAPQPLADRTNRPSTVSAAHAKPAVLTQQGLFGHTPRPNAPISQCSLSSASSQPSQAPAEVHASQGHVSLAPAHSLVHGLRIGKVWDNRIFVEQQNRVIKRKPDEDDDEEAAAMLLQEPLPHSSPRPMKLVFDRQQGQSWIYPINKPLRDYQLNIVRKALFNNVLVALPTGLGKTFIAAVVILNMFRWFPEGKIIFVAPTRPLVTQQQQACHSICGLPWDTAIELTGSTKRSLRDDEWHMKRIFYMTPQTFENDLLSTTCDPRDVVCVVVDEAHRATGNYAYCKVIRHLMYHNPHFRVLALTATPGNKAERVQEVVTNLHINRIEIRTEEALDIQPYIHGKKEELVRVSLGAPLESLRATWGKLMAHYYEPLQRNGILRPCDPLQLRSFAVRSAGSDSHGRAILQSRPFLRGHLQQLANMALITQYLSEQSVRVFCERAMAMSSPGKGRTRREQLFSTSNGEFRELVEKIEHVQADAHLLLHPKMHKLREVLMKHFDQHCIRQLQHEETRRETRAMVFCSFREVVTEIVDMLNQAGLSSTPFIGQASDTKGNRGFTQKMQEQVIRDFQQGKYQVLVATSIGEEGLDIGEIDLIVCYDAVRDSVRGLQRIGRTGRMRDGHVVVLMTEGREENNWAQSKESYKSVQRLVNSANMIELYTDVSRLVPDDVKPKPVMQCVEQPPFDPSVLKPAPKPRQRAPPKKRGRAVPQGDLSRFCSAAELHRRDEHREESLAPVSHVPAEKPAPSSSRSSTLLRSSSLQGTFNLSDDSDDAELHADVSTYSWSSSDRSGTDAPRRHAPHPLIAELDRNEAADAAPPPSPSLAVPPSPSLSRSNPDPVLSSPPVQRTPPPKRGQAKRRRIGASPTSRLLFCHEAERETDSEEHGESDEDDDGPSSSEENDEDRAHVGDFEATQQEGYNQQSVYLQSMLSQNAPTPFRRRDRLESLLRRRDALRPSSEGEVPSMDDYSQDSFVVGDDEISWASSQESILL